MEAAFANGQELVIFVTGLNTGEASVEFLKEYNCERYYRYNKELLFDNQENEMKEVLGNDDAKEKTVGKAKTVGTLFPE